MIRSLVLGMVSPSRDVELALEHLSLRSREVQNDGDFGVVNI